MRPVPNLTLRREDGRVVAESVVVADSTGRRLRGLLGKQRPAVGPGRPPPPRVVDPHGVHALSDRRRLPRRRPDRRQDRPEPAGRSRPRRVAARARSSSSAPANASAAGLALGDRVAWAARAADEAAPASRSPTSKASAAGSVVLASSDQRYVKLVRFLLDGKGIGVAASVPPQRAAEVASGEPADVVVIDAGAVTEGLRLANVTRARRPEATVVLVGEDAGGHAHRPACASTRSGTTRTASSRRSRTRSSARPCSLEGLRAGVVAEHDERGSGHE